MRMGTVVITGGHDRGGYDRGGDRGGYDRGGYDRGGMTGGMFAIRTFTATARNGRKLPIAVAMAETGKK